MIRRIGVFCGSRAGSAPVYGEQAHVLADALVARGIGLVYGGGRIGLMGLVADRVLAGGGEAIGVIPRGLFRREMVHESLSELRVVDTLMERKELMIALADGFAVLPGGLGTADELFEVLTWAQLGLHDKPCGLVNLEGYYDALLALIDDMVKAGFVAEAHRALLVVEREPAALIDRMARLSTGGRGPAAVGGGPRR